MLIILPSELINLFPDRLDAANLVLAFAQFLPNPLESTEKQDDKKDKVVSRFDRRNMAPGANWGRGHESLLGDAISEVCYGPLNDGAASCRQRCTW